MPRNRRVVIDEADFEEFENIGLEWFDRANLAAYIEDPVAPQDDYEVVGVPTFFTGGETYGSVTVWGMGLITFGAPTDTQRAYMAGLSAGTDLTAFLAGFPGDYIAAGFRSGGYGEMEFGRGQRDPAANPFSGGYREPFDTEYEGPTLFERTQAEALTYVVWSGEPFEGPPDDFPGGGIWPDGTHQVDFTAQGFFVRGGGLYRIDGQSGTLAGNDGVYFSDLNPWQGSEGADEPMPQPGPSALFGNGGDDALTGGGAADRLVGGDGNDTIVGGGGVDRIEGGEGNDDLTDGDERGFLSGGGGDDLIRPGAGEDVIDGGAGHDAVLFDFSAMSAGTTFRFMGGAADYLLPGGYKHIENVEAVHLLGGSGQDDLGGADGNDLLSQDGGGGRLSGRGGHDELRGGSGSDAAAGGEGDDRLFGDSGRDVLSGGAGDDYLDGGAGGGTLVLLDDSPLLAAPFSIDADPNVVVQFATADTTRSASFSFTVDENGRALFLELAFGDDAGGSFQPFDYILTVYGIDGSELKTVFAGPGGTFTSDFDFTDDGSPLPAGRYSIAISSYAPDARTGIPQARLFIHAAQSDGDYLDGGLGNDVYIVDSADDSVTEESGAGTDEIRTGLASYSLTAPPDVLFRADLSHVENLTGGTADQLLGGNGRANRIDGGAGADTMSGFGGNDVYVLDNAGDVVVEAAGEGIDRVVSIVSVTLGGHVEYLTLAGAAAIGGTGNGLDNVITGNAAANLLNGAAGNDRMSGGGGGDRLNGGTGGDLMIGGGGNDIYHVNAAADRILETSSLDGIDKVVSSVSYTLGNHVENLTLTGSAAINGNGNDLSNVVTGNAAANLLSGAAGNDRMFGGAGNDRLNGGAGGDIMSGGRGNDIYYVNAAGDQAVETGASDGVDKVASSVRFTLGNFVEKLVLTGTAAINGIGNGLDNVIAGNGAVNSLNGAGGNDTVSAGSGDDRLYGGAGNDVLRGGAGSDAFYFNTALNKTANVDRILDFSSGADTIILDDAVFTDIAVGTLSSSAFHVGAAAADGGDRIIYDKAAGRIYYDADGNGAAAAMLFATVAAGTTLASADFVGY